MPSLLLCTRVGVIHIDLYDAFMGISCFVYVEYWCSLRPYGSIRAGVHTYSMSVLAREDDWSTTRWLHHPFATVGGEASRLFGFFYK